MGLKGREVEAWGQTSEVRVYLVTTLYMPVVSRVLHSYVGVICTRIVDRNHVQNVMV